MTLKEKLVNVSYYLSGFPKSRKDKHNEYIFREMVTGKESRDLLKKQRNIRLCDILIKNFFNAIYVASTLSCLEDSSRAPYLGSMIASGEMARFVTNYLRGSITDLLSNERKNEIIDSMDRQTQSFN